MTPHLDDGDVRLYVGDEPGGRTRRAGCCMTCDRCGRTATCVAWEEPENDGALLFGDELIGVLLCGACLSMTVADGPWDGVEALEAA